MTGQDSLNPSSQHSAGQERWVLIHYSLLLLSLLVPVLVLVPLLVSMQLLNQQQDVWVRSHLLWIMRSSAGYVVFILVTLLLTVPLFWWPYQQGNGWIVLMVAGGVSVLGWLWLLYRNIKGLHAFFRGKAVY